MPRYFLHIEIEGELVEDLDGEEFETLEEARRMAIATAREIMNVSPRLDHLADKSVIDIADHDGQTALLVPFGDAVGRM